MKKLAVGILIGLCLVSAASAYLVVLQAPDRINAGETLNVTIDHTVPRGTTTDIVLYRTGYTKKEVARKTFTFQGEPVVLNFKTDGYTDGIYQLELVDPTGDTFGSSSTVRRVVEIVNRTADLTLTSETTQSYDGTLDLAGRVRGLEDRGIQITVENIRGPVFGPVYVSTDANGAFREEIPIEDPGVYRVDFSDYRGHITTVRFFVSPIEGTTASTTVIPTTPGTTATAVPTPAASATTPATPLPAALALLAIAFAILKRS
ncbi:MAG: hypothetical protein QMD46_07200 [Methanomicrobiales archaeon]|nr:hypothetical protein [Methanomicrobiales archaeon]